MGSIAEAEALPSDDRFVVLGEIGSGGMGVVYRARDRATGRLVALKTLTGPAARDLYRFKREFRSLCDLNHPSLCTLHELHTADDTWFFTMELVPGVSFIDWVRPSLDSDRAVVYGDDDHTAPRRVPLRTREQIRGAPVDLDRLEAALGQLCDGVYALHAAGKLHRDLKPSNVLCEPGGRLVVLDFGLVADVDLISVERTHEHASVGTPAYMSPEQAADQTLTAASDWYSVGAMLYEALVGHRPFEGKPEEVMRRKQLELPTSPRRLAPHVPQHLDELCTALLMPDPRDRLDGAAVLDALGREPSVATSSVERTTGPFVGREVPLAALHRALVDSRQGGTTVFVRANSGMGKSALIGRFLQSVGDSALVLAGRCHERETVPYKALDRLIDALTGALLQLPPADLAEILPRDVGLLAKLFPVLRRVPAIAEPTQRRFETVDPQESRRRGFGALRYLLGRLAERRPVVLCIDDLQWGDADSAGFLADLITRADRPPVLTVLVYRSEDRDHPLIAAVVPPATATRVVTLELLPLTTEEARDLVATLSGLDGDLAAWTDALMGDAGGNTMFLAELARSAAGAGEASSLDELLRRRVARLSADARALLTACAVAGRPIALELAARAAGVDNPQAAVSLLRAERMIRSGRGERETLEPFHDRIRAAIVDDLAAAPLRALHLTLAAAYLELAPREREPLVDHLLAGDQPARAAVHAVVAAEAAAQAFAFRRAADLYAIALEHGLTEPAARLAVLTTRAEALVHAGQLVAAAALYGEAAALAGDDDRFQLQRLRLEQLLRAGALREGLSEARTMLAALGYALPESRRGTMWSLFRQRLGIKLGGGRWRERSAAELPAEALRTVDALSSIASGLSFVNPMLGKVVQLWYLTEAFKLGEPHRITTALANEGGYLGMAGIKTRRAVEGVLGRARALAEKTADPYLLGLVATTAGFAHFMVGRWRPARPELETGLRLMGERGVRARWELDMTEFYLLATLSYLGETRELIRLVPLMLREAEDRGDVFAQHGLRSWRSNVVWLLTGKPEDARAHVLAVTAERRDVVDFCLHDYYQLLANAQIDLYVGDGDGALDRFERAWAALDHAFLFRIQTIRIESQFALGRAALVAGGTARRAIARRSAAKLAREGVPWAAALSQLLVAGIVQANGDVAEATRDYAEAERRFEALDMALFARVARLAGAELAGDAALVARTRAELTDGGIVDPDRVSRMLAPRP